MATTVRDVCPSRRAAKASRNSIERAVGDPEGSDTRISTALEPPCQRRAHRVEFRKILRSAILRTVSLTTSILATNSSGSTVSLVHGNLAGRPLFAVAVYAERTFEISDQPTSSQLVAFIISNLDILLRPDHALGTWFDKERAVYVFDVVICLADRNRAIQLGMHLHQKAIFDLAAGADIVLAKAGAAASVRSGRGRL